MKTNIHRLDGNGVRLVRWCMKTNMNKTTRKLIVRTKPQSRLFTKSLTAIIKILTYIFKSILGLAFMIGGLIICLTVFGTSPATNQSALISFINQGIESMNMFFFWYASVFLLVLCYLVFNSLFDFKK